MGLSEPSAATELTPKNQSSPRTPSRRTVGAVVSVLTWSYVSSLILLFGAQLTAVFHREHPA